MIANRGFLDSICTPLEKIIDYCSSSGATSGACNHCRSKSFAIDGTTYYGQLPNMIELNDIIRNHTALDTADPTASSYSSVNFTANTGQSIYTFRGLVCK